MKEKQDVQEKVNSLWHPYGNAYSRSYSYLQVNQISAPVLFHSIPQVPEQNKQTNNVLKAWATSVSQATTYKINIIWYKKDSLQGNISLLWWTNLLTEKLIIQLNATPHAVMTG